MLLRNIKTSCGNDSSKLGRALRKVTRCDQDRLFVFARVNPHSGCFVLRIRSRRIIIVSFRAGAGRADPTLGKDGPWPEVQRGTTTTRDRPLCFFFMLCPPHADLFNLSSPSPSSVPSVSIAIYERSPRTFPRKLPLVTCAKSLCDYNRSPRCSTSIRSVARFPFFFFCEWVLM